MFQRLVLAPSRIPFILFVAILAACEKPSDLAAPLAPDTVPTVGERSANVLSNLALNNLITNQAEASDAGAETPPDSSPVNDSNANPVNPPDSGGDNAANPPPGDPAGESADNSGNSGNDSAPSSASDSGGNSAGSTNSDPAGNSGGNSDGPDTICVRDQVQFRIAVADIDDVIYAAPTQRIPLLVILDGGCGSQYEILGADEPALVTREPYARLEKLVYISFPFTGNYRRNIFVNSIAPDGRGIASYSIELVFSIQGLPPLPGAPCRLTAPTVDWAEIFLKLELFEPTTSAELNLAGVVVPLDDLLLFPFTGEFFQADEEDIDQVLPASATITLADGSTRVCPLTTANGAPAEVIVPNPEVPIDIAAFASSSELQAHAAFCAFSPDCFWNSGKFVSQFGPQQVAGVFTRVTRVWRAAVQFLQTPAIAYTRQKILLGNTSNGVDFFTLAQEINGITTDGQIHVTPVLNMSASGIAYRLEESPSWAGVRRLSATTCSTQGRRPCPNLPYPVR